MSPATSTSTWNCPNCHRNVPRSEEVCRCGTPRPQTAPAQARDLLNSWEVLGLLVALALSIGFAIYSVMHPAPPPRMVPVLGHIDPTPPPSPARPRR